METTATKLHEYLRTAFDDARVGFYLAGYRVEDRVSVPHLYAGPHDEGATAPQPERRHDRLRRVAGGRQRHREPPDPAGVPPAFDAMPLQDAVDYAVHPTRTTIDTLRFEPRHPTVGGPIDVMTVTPEGCSRAIRRKEVTVAD